MEQMVQNALVCIQDAGVNERLSRATEPTTLGLQMAVEIR
jgi:hypothetical protein